ncbi:hypothetical protein JYU34_005943 [Plutella xylostella]|uniref:Uncharacterized protein n=1 Tax=Plutella xylostella TaxID=51655 RepID=A0ABQ7QUJ0_PLUXY|nr:hypothetical protein JYU34_005943 [Plutella xylostella]
MKGLRAWTHVYGAAPFAVQRYGTAAGRWRGAVPRHGVVNRHDTLSTYIKIMLSVSCRYTTPWRGTAPRHLPAAVPYRCTANGAAP